MKHVIRGTVFKRLLVAVVLLWTFGAGAQFLTPIVTGPFHGPFLSSGPLAFFNQNAAVNYDLGGRSIGYNVPSPNCVGVTCAAGASTYRADAVNFKASTFGSGFNWQLAFSQSPNSWNYTISITQPGPYIITLWTGTGAGTGGSWNVLIDNQVVGNVATPNSGWATPTASSSAALNPQPTLGTHVLTLAWATGDSAGGNGDLVAWQGAVYTGGGGGPTPPAAAVAANMTTCVICMDFTAPSGGVFVNGTAVAGANASQPNTWLDCAGASNPIWFHRNNEANVGSQPCPTITTDGGVQVMQMYVPAGENVVAGSGTNQGNGIESVNTPAGTGNPVPTNNYMEATFKVPNFPFIGSCGGCGNGDAYIQGPWLGSGDGALTGGTWNCLEWDAFEVNHDTNPGAFASATGSWCPSGNTGLGGNWFGTYPPTWTADGDNFETQYIKVGQRVTSDGTTFYKCMWINDHFQNCFNNSVNGTYFQSWQLSDATSRMAWYYSIALFHAPDSSHPSYVTPAGGMVGNTMSINMWACTNWKTTACTTSSADPGGY